MGKAKLNEPWLTFLFRRILVRMSSWRDFLTISAEFDIATCAKGTIEQLLNDMVQLMLVLI